MYDNLTRTNLEFAYREAEKRIAQLEKENAELKEEMNAKQVVLNDFKSRVETVTGRFNKISSQLTKAKEYIDKVYGNRTEMDHYGIAGAFQDGAEFGYNKAKEWHILAEEPGTLPKEGQKVKVFTEDNIIQESTYFYDDYFEEMAFSDVGLVKVIAWKEIVLPELKEGCLHETEDKKKNDF